MSVLRDWLCPQEIPAWQYYLRLLAIVIQCVLAYSLAQSNPFFYQGF